MPKYIDFTTGNSLLDEGIENYLVHGYEPGGFLTAVLANDLFLAASRADYKNQQNLAHIARSIYHGMPPNSFGNYEIVKDWLKDKDKRRSTYSERKLKEYTLKILKGQVDEKVLQDPPF